MRRGTIENIQNLDSRKLSHLKKRVFENHDITAANAQINSDEAGKENFVSMIALNKAKTIVRQYYDEKGRIERRIKSRMIKSPSDTSLLIKPPKLSTAARAEKRRQAFELKMQKLYGADWR